MPALVGPLAGFALGAALAWLCRREAVRDEDASSRGRAAVAALFGALVFAPACAYFLAFAGDWSLFYLVDSRAVPSAALLVLVVVDAALVALGFVAGHGAARRRRGRALVALSAGPAIVAAALVLTFSSRLRVVGTIHQIQGRFGTQPLAGSALGWAVLWMGAMVLAGFVVAARALAERPSPRAPAAPDHGPIRRPTFLGLGR